MEQDQLLETYFDESRNGADDTYIVNKILR